MANGTYLIPHPSNEPVLNYAPGAAEREALNLMYTQMWNSEMEVPMYIGIEEIFTDDKRPLTSPHQHQHRVGTANFGTAAHVQKAIDAALEARKAWAEMPWQGRAAIFLKAADLLAGPFRARINAATMIAQSKNAFQAEIDAACELIDFFRFNAYYMQQIYNQQPESLPGIWNRLEYRPLEGFVFAVTPFNFTSIAANLPAAPAMMGNTVVWKPADSQIYSARVIMELFKAAGLPDGVINMVTVDGPTAGEVVFGHRDFAGLHFTGSTAVFKQMWKTIGSNIDRYRSYPRIVGETGGKDFVMVHASADPLEVATALARGAFEFQGQKCSAASRAYLPASRADEILELLVTQVKSMKMGAPDDYSNFINAVIDARAFKKISGYIDFIRQQPDARILAGGRCDDSVGYFIEPTVVLTENPAFRTMCEEIFGPVLTIYIYKDEEFEQTLRLLDATGDYALTGSIMARDRYAIETATRLLVHAAGNFYINDKPTGAVVGQQPFGGARGSGTNDKAGSYLNLLRWASPRTIKETFVPPVDYRYPFMG
jgi:1-pyrroline-5-carboxylate dehydrogenase